jgi:hypothetical protein
MEWDGPPLESSDNAPYRDWDELALCVIVARPILRFLKRRVF